MKQRIKNNVKLALLFIFSSANPAYAINNSNISLTELLHLFSQQPQSTVDFKETKHAFYLEEPLKSSGYLQFSAPNKLYRFILKPEKTSQKITGNKLEVTRADKTHSISLEDHPELSIILHSLIGLLSGDYVLLKNNFKITFENTPASWLLSLTPRDSYTSSYVASIKLYGNKAKLIKIVVIESNDDRSVTQLYNHR